MTVGVVDRVRGALPELTKFGLVGVASLIVDLAVFNLLLHTVMPDKPLTAKAISAVVSTTNAFVLNRQWSFKARSKRALHREYVEFFVINAGGLAIALLCLYVSHYPLGLTSRLADNVASYGFGLVFGTAFRFWGYRKWVWAHKD